MISNNSSWNRLFGVSMDLCLQETLSNSTLAQKLECQRLCKETRFLQFALKMIAGLGLILATTNFGTFTFLILPRRWTRVILPRLTSHEKASSTFVFNSGCCLISWVGWLALDLKIKDRFFSSLIKQAVGSSEATQTEVWKLVKKYSPPILSLNLAGKNITTPLLKQLVEQFTSLKQLTIPANGLNALDLKKIEDCPNLKRLDLCGTLNIANEEYQVFENFTQLQELEIQEAAHLASEGFTSICTLANQALRCLVIRAPHLDPSAIPSLSIAMKPHLTKLALYVPNVKSEHLKPLFEGNLPKLRQICFTLDESTEEIKKIRRLVRQVGCNWEYQLHKQENYCEIYYIDAYSDSD